MSWTYSGDPAASDADAVRFLIGDTSTTDQQLQDAEIAYLLTTEGSVYRAAAQAARSIGAKYARLVDKSVGDLRLSYSQRAASYEKLAASLVARATTRTATPYAGGISAADKALDEQDTDLAKPAFTVGQFDFPGTTPETEDDA